MVRLQLKELLELFVNRRDYSRFHLSISSRYELMNECLKAKVIWCHKILSKSGPLPLLKNNDKA